MIRRTLGLLAGMLLLGPVSCLDEEGPEPFTTENTCVPGETGRCDCSSGGRGIRTCTREGVFGDCLCPGCTTFPDCQQCDPDDCFENCMCWSGRPDPLVCESTCEDLSDDTASCNADECPAPPDDVPEVFMSEACCTEGGACGFSFVGACLEPGQEGMRDPACPQVMVGDLELEGCCRADGFCGGLEETFGLGCIDANELNGNPAVACGGPVE